MISKSVLKSTATRFSLAMPDAGSKPSFAITRFCSPSITASIFASSVPHASNFSGVVLSRSRNATTNSGSNSFNSSFVNDLLTARDE